MRAGLLAFYRPFVRDRRRDLLIAGAVACGMVGLRLALPWPLKHIVSPWLKGKVEADGATTALHGGFLFFGIYVALGACDYYARSLFARFAVDLIHDLRLALPEQVSSGQGDHLARMIGDTARLKEGLKGFLIHVATNGIYMIGLVVVLLTIDVWLGVIFALSLGVVFLVSLGFMRRIGQRSKTLRKREGRLAQTIHQYAPGGRRAKKRIAVGPQVKPSRKRPNGTLTVIQGRASWSVHVILAAFVLCCLALAGPGGPRELKSKDLVVFMTYLLHMYHPVVRLARQLTRVGKLEACAERIRAVFEAEEEQHEPDLPALTRGLRWRDFCVRAGNRGGGGMRLGPLDLELRLGERVAVVGPRGSGKTTLVNSVAQRTRAKSLGLLSWDETDLTVVSTRSRRAQVGRAAKTLEGGKRREGVGVIVGDDLLDGLSGEAAVEQLGGLFDAAGPCLVLVTMRRPQLLERFDRVLFLREGHLVLEEDSP